MPSTVPSGESINRRFRYIVTTLYLVVVGLVLWLFGTQWRGYWDAYEAEKEFIAVQAALRAMADVSSERRPTFAVLVAESPPTAEQLHAMVAARQDTDARLNKLGAALRDPDCRHCASLVPQWERARNQLTEARQHLDALRGMPRDELTDTATLDGFAHLADTIPQLSSMAETGAMGVIRENADVQSYLLVARLSALLREHAGMLVSQFAPALMSRRTLTEQETFDIARTLGKIDQLRLLMEPSIRVLPALLRSDYADIDKRYFGDALTLIDHLRQSAQSPSDPDELPLRVSERYGPLIIPINRFRDDALALTQSTIRDSLRWHLIYLVASGIFAALLTGLLLLMIWRFRERIIRPFVEARRVILAIASGNPSVSLPRKQYGGEVRELFSALRVLKENDARRLKLEKERKRLISELKTMAETDTLTGLLNRRAFESRSNVLLADERSNDPVVALMLMDIDHFKRINDTYGHDSGDKALVLMASVCRETVRADDIVARFGGEEFVVLSRVKESQQAHALAERLRLRLHDETTVTADGQSFGFTVSIGVAFARQDDGNPIDVESLLREADALLYRAKESGRNRVETAPPA
jgi:diguanylate cyclase (GGDEF)-like protein